MRPETLQAALLTHHHQAGLHLVKPDDHFLHLMRSMEKVASFSQLGATVKAIRDAADKYLAGGY